MNQQELTGTPLRVGVVGARRRHQGIGEHVARFFARHGAEVCGIVGTREETVAQAREHLQAQYGIDARGYLQLEEMQAAEQLDAVAICSPFAAHAEQLQAALASGLHVLCEKPLVYDEQGAFASQAADLIDAFAAAGQWLLVNEQWPYTLSGFQRLHPDAELHRPPRSLELALAPGSSGLRHLPDALPHVLSLLLALAPLGGDAEHVTYRQQGEEIQLTFRYAHRLGVTDVCVSLRQVLQQPRPAAYAINGRAARRVIDLPEYTMYFEPVDHVAEAFDLRAECFVEPRRQPLADPLELLVRDFVRRVSSHRRPTRNAVAVESSRLLATIDQAVRRNGAADSTNSRPHGRGPHTRATRNDASTKSFT